MKISIITEGNLKVGFGHISRCLSLYQAFIEIKITPHLIINGDTSVKQFLTNTNHIFLNWLKDTKILFDIIKESDIIIVDSYLADKSLYIKISKSGKLSVFIDDIMRLNYPEGVIINSMISAEDLKYPKKQNTKYLLGPEYCMLRKEFWDVSQKVINEKIKNVLITFGGNDLRNLTPKIIKFLIDEFPNLQLKVIIGKGFKNIREIEEIDSKNIKLFYYPSPIKIINIMSESDLGISAGGQTVYELAALGIPCITISIANNQILSVKTFSELGLNYYAGSWKEASLLETIKKSIIEIKKIETRQKMSNLAEKTIKVDGSRKIIKNLLSLL